MLAEASDKLVTLDFSSPVLTESTLQPPRPPSANQTSEIISHYKTKESLTLRSDLSSSGMFSGNPSADGDRLLPRQSAAVL